MESERVEVGLLLRRVRRMKHGALAFALFASGLGAGCSAPSSTSSAASEVDLYLNDATARRAELVASLVNPINAYSQLRLAHYDTGDSNDWSRLPESNPRVDVIQASELDAPGGVSVGGAVTSGAAALTLDAAALQGDPAALLALGEAAFFRYPVEVSLPAETATTSRATFASYGFWTDDTHGAGGLVREETPNGASVLAYTCATCHAASRGGSLVIGVGNDTLDLGKLIVDASPGTDPTIAGRALSWGPGRLDVTTTDGTEPVRIADTRPVQWLGYLHADATVRVNDLTSVAIRLETLIITSHALADRPPRVIALALATYVESLSSTLPLTPSTSPSELHGQALFQSTCTGCHAPPAFTGTPVPLDVVGTNPTIGLSPNRGTGTYAVPSLHGVSTRGPLLHDASLPSLAAMFDPSRTAPSYEGSRLGPGPVPGHLFGLDLSSSDRADLLAYLATL